MFRAEYLEFSLSMLKSVYELACLKLFDTLKPIFVVENIHGCLLLRKSVKHKTTIRLKNAQNSLKPENQQVFPILYKTVSRNTEVFHKAQNC